VTRTISLKSGAVYSGTTALDIVEQMREGDFDPPPTVRDYIVRATARASHYFGTTLRIHPNTGTEAELAEEFIAQAIAKGFAEEILSS
jgi:hypothetical protein